MVNSQVAENESGAVCRICGRQPCFLLIKYRLRYKMPPAEHEKRGSESDGVLIIKTSPA